MGVALVSSGAGRTCWPARIPASARRPQSRRVLPRTVADRRVGELLHPALLVLSDALVLDLVQDAELLPLDEGGRARCAAPDRLPPAHDPVGELHLALEREVAAARPDELREEARVGAVAAARGVQLERVAVLGGPGRRVGAARPDYDPHPLRQEHGQAPLLLDLRNVLPELVRKGDLPRPGRE